MTTQADDATIDPQVERGRLECLVWCRDWMRWSAIAATVAAAVFAVVVIGLAGETRWKPRLLKTGVKTTGTVVEVHTGRGRNDSDRLTIRVNDPSMTVSIDNPSPLDRYYEGQETAIWYDPRNQNHARTLWDATSDGSEDVAGIAAGVVVLGAALALYRFTTAGRLRWKLRRHEPTTFISRIGWKSAGKNTRTLFDIDGALFTIRRTVSSREARLVCGRGRARAVFAFTQPHERRAIRCRPYLVRRSIVPFRERYWRTCRAVEWERRSSKPKRRRNGRR
jgi:hypothetical protein